MTLQLPSASESHFPELMRRYESTLANPEEHYTEILRARDRSPDERFAALYGVLHRLRRAGRLPEYVELMREFEFEFSGQPFFETFRVVSRRWAAEDPRSLREALGSAKRALQRLPNEPSVLHQYAEVVASLAELDSSTPKSWISDALEQVNKAIDLRAEKNPNHFATRARCHLALGDFSAARSDVAIAIAVEDSKSPDFASRIGRYESVRSLIVIRQAQDEFAEKQAKVLEELSSFRAQQLQLLGLLAAMIALVVAGVSTATRVEPNAAAELLLVSAGSTGIVFAAFSSLLAGSRLWRVVFALIVSGGLIALGIYLASH